MEKRGDMANTVRTYRRGEVIFRQGDDGDCMFDIRRGMVGIYAHYGTKKERLLTRLVTEDCFGEMALLEGLPRSATAVSLQDDTRVMCVTKASFGRYLQEKPGKVLRIMQQMSARIRKLTEDYISACRALSEEMDAEHSGKGKSEWFWNNREKFTGDLERGADNCGGSV